MNKRSTAILVTLMLISVESSASDFRNIFYQLAPCVAGLAISTNVFKTKNTSDMVLGCILFHGFVNASEGAKATIDHTKNAETLEEQLKLEERRPAQYRIDVSK